MDTDFRCKRPAGFGGASDLRWAVRAVCRNGQCQVEEARRHVEIAWSSVNLFDTATLLFGSRRKCWQALGTHAKTSFWREGFVALEPGPTRAAFPALSSRLRGEPCAWERLIDLYQCHSFDSLLRG